MKKYKYYIRKVKTSGNNFQVRIKELDDKCLELISDIRKLRILVNKSLIN